MTWYTLDELNRKIKDMFKIKYRWIKFGTYPTWLDGAQARLSRLRRDALELAGIKLSRDYSKKDKRGK